MSEVIRRDTVIDETQAWKPQVALLFWRCLETLRLGWLSYRASNPIRVVAMTSAPRIALQCIFFALIGRLLDGPAGQRYAFIGCVAFGSLTATLVAICDVPMEDLWNATYFRLQRGVIPPALVYALRAIPMVAEGFAESVLVLVVCGPLLGLGRLSWSLAPYLPLYLLITITSAMGGLAVAGIAVGKRKDVLLGNLAAYVVLATGAIVAPPPASAQWLGIVGDIVPARHGVQAVRSALAGGPWLAQTLLESVVGLCWLAVAIAVITHANRRAATQ